MADRTVLVDDGGYVCGVGQRRVIRRRREAGLCLYCALESENRNERSAGERQRHFFGLRILRHTKTCVRVLAVTAKYHTVPERYHTSINYKGVPMAAYTCDKCGMSVNMTCGQCGQDLVHDTITTGDDSTVAVSNCPDGHGMIKSPLCCAQDMTCSV